MYMVDKRPTPSGAKWINLSIHSRQEVNKQPGGREISMQEKKKQVGK